MHFLCLWLESSWRFSFSSRTLFFFVRIWLDFSSPRGENGNLRSSHSRLHNERLSELSGHHEYGLIDACSCHETLPFPHKCSYDTTYRRFHFIAFDSSIGVLLTIYFFVNKPFLLCTDMAQFFFFPQREKWGIFIPSILDQVYPGGLAATNRDVLLRWSLRFL